MTFDINMLLYYYISIIYMKIDLRYYDIKTT